MRRFPLSAARFAGAVHPTLVCETLTNRFTLFGDVVRTTLPFLTFVLSIITMRVNRVNRFRRDPRDF